MAAAITVECPECEEKLRAPEDARGKKVRCKSCGHAFVVPAAPKAAAKAPAKPPAKSPAKPNAKAQAKPAAAPKAPAPAPVPPPADDEGDAKPYGVVTLELSHRCPECANELESEEAVICLACGYNTQTRTRHLTKKVYEPTGGERFMWLLPGILSAIGFLSLIGFDIFYWMEMPDLTKDHWYEFLGSGAIIMWVIIGSLFGMFYAARFAIKRLVFHPNPPEVEKG